ncbi:MAG: hypothetical protein RIM84_12630 [Alphaproteobacteria bacterium]
MRLIKRLCFVLIALVLAVVAIVMIVSALAIQRQPAVVDGSSARGFEVVRAKALARRTLRALTAYGNETSLTTSDADIAAILAFVARPVRGAMASADITERGVRCSLTLPLPVPDNPLGRYLNFSATLLMPQDGVRLQDASLGKLHVASGRMVLRAIRVLGDYVAGDMLVSHVIDSVRRIEMEDEVIRVTFAPLGPRGSDLRTAVERLSSTR